MPRRAGGGATPGLIRGTRRNPTTNAQRAQNVATIRARARAAALRRARR